MTTGSEDFEADRRANQRGNLRFIDSYAAWVLLTPNEVWSREQNRFLADAAASAISARRALGIECCDACARQKARRARKT